MEKKRPKVPVDYSDWFGFAELSDDYKPPPQPPPQPAIRPVPTVQKPLSETFQVKPVLQSPKQNEQKTDRNGVDSEPEQLDRKPTVKKFKILIRKNEAGQRVYSTSSGERESTAEELDLLKDTSEIEKNNMSRELPSGVHTKIRSLSKSVSLSEKDHTEGLLPSKNLVIKDTVRKKHKNGVNDKNVDFTSVIDKNENITNSSSAPLHTAEVSENVAIQDEQTAHEQNCCNEKVGENVAEKKRRESSVDSEERTRLSQSSPVVYNSSVSYKKFMFYSPERSPINECSVVLKKDPTIESLHGLRSSINCSEVSSESSYGKHSSSNSPLSTADSVEESEKGKALCPSVTSPILNVGVKDQKKTTPELIFDADIDRRKSSRLSSVTCSSRYRGDYGIRADTYTKMATKQKITPPTTPTTPSTPSTQNTSFLSACNVHVSGPIEIHASLQPRHKTAGKKKSSNTSKKTGPKLRTSLALPASDRVSKPRSFRPVMELSLSLINSLSQKKEEMKSSLKGVEHSSLTSLQTKSDEKVHDERVVCDNDQFNVDGLNKTENVVKNNVSRKCTESVTEEKDVSGTWSSDQSVDLKNSGECVPCENDRGVLTLEISETLQTETATESQSYNIDHCDAESKGASDNVRIRDAESVDDSDVDKDINRQEKVDVDVDAHEKFKSAEEQNVDSQDLFGFASLEQSEEVEDKKVNENETGPDLQEKTAVVFQYSMIEPNNSANIEANSFKKASASSDSICPVIGMSEDTNKQQANAQEPEEFTLESSVCDRLETGLQQHSEQQNRVQESSLSVNEKSARHVDRPVSKSQVVVDNSTVVSSDASLEQIADCATALEKLRLKLFAQAGANPILSDRVPKVHVSKIVSEKKKGPGSGKKLLPREELKFNKSQVSPDVVELLEKTCSQVAQNVLQQTLSCASDDVVLGDTDGAILDLVQDVNVPENSDMTSQKRKPHQAAKNTFHSKPKRQRFEDKEFMLRSLKRKALPTDESVNDLSLDSCDSPKQSRLSGEAMMVSRAETLSYSNAKLVMKMSQLNTIEGDTMTKAESSNNCQNLPHTDLSAMKQTKVSDTVSVDSNHSENHTKVSTKENERSVDLKRVKSDKSDKEMKKRKNKTEDKKGKDKKQQKPVKCPLCSHMFKTKEHLRKHYPCRIKQTRTWSQNVLRPNRAFARKPVHKKQGCEEFKCLLPKRMKSSNPRPHLLNPCKTKFRRVKGKRRRKLLQTINELIEKRKIVCYPHLCVDFSALSYKEQFFYKLGLSYIGTKINLNVMGTVKGPVFADLVDKTETEEHQGTESLSSAVQLDDNETKINELSDSQINQEIVTECSTVEHCENYLHNVENDSTELSEFTQSNTLDLQMTLDNAVPQESYSVNTHLSEELALPSLDMVVIEQNHTDSVSVELYNEDVFTELVETEILESREIVIGEVVSNSRSTVVVKADIETQTDSAELSGDVTENVLSSKSISEPTEVCLEDTESHLEGMESVKNIEFGTEGEEDLTESMFASIKGIETGTESVKEITEGISASSEDIQTSIESIEITEAIRSIENTEVNSGVTEDGIEIGAEILEPETVPVGEKTEAFEDHTEVLTEETSKEIADGSLDSVTERLDNSTEYVEDSAELPSVEERPVFPLESELVLQVDALERHDTEIPPVLEKVDPVAGGKDFLPCLPESPELEKVVSLGPPVLEPIELKGEISEKSSDANVMESTVLENFMEKSSESIVETEDVHTNSAVPVDSRVESGESVHRLNNDMPIRGCTPVELDTNSDAASPTEINTPTKTSTPAKISTPSKMRAERHFLDIMENIGTPTLDILSEISGSKQPVSKLTFNKMDTLLDKTLTPIKKSSQLILNKQKAERHFTDFIDDSLLQEERSDRCLNVRSHSLTAAHASWEKSDKGELTLVEIKEILRPNSSRENVFSKESLMKLWSDLGTLFTGKDAMKSSKKNQPHGLQSEKKSQTETGLRNRKSLFDALTPRSPSVESQVSLPGHPVNSESESEYHFSDEEGNTTRKFSDSYAMAEFDSDDDIMKSENGNITDKILQMLTSLEDKGNLAENMTNVLHLLAENLGIGGGQAKNDGDKKSDSENSVYCVTDDSSYSAQILSEESEDMVNNSECAIAPPGVRMKKIEKGDNYILFSRHTQKGTLEISMDQHSYDKGEIEVEAEESKEEGNEDTLLENEECIEEERRGYTEVPREDQEADEMEGNDGAEEHLEKEEVSPLEVGLKPNTEMRETHEEEENLEDGGTKALESDEEDTDMVTSDAEMQEEADDDDEEEEEEGEEELNESEDTEEDNIEEEEASSAESQPDSEMEKVRHEDSGSGEESEEHEESNREHTEEDKVSCAEKKSDNEVQYVEDDDDEEEGEEDSVKSEETNFSDREDPDEEEKNYSDCESLSTSEKQDAVEKNDQEMVKGGVQISDSDTDSYSSSEYPQALRGKIESELDDDCSVATEDGLNEDPWTATVETKDEGLMSEDSISLVDDPVDMKRSREIVISDVEMEEVTQSSETDLGDEFQTKRDKSASDRARAKSDSPLALCEDKIDEEIARQSARRDASTIFKSITELGSIHDDDSLDDSFDAVMMSKRLSELKAVQGDGTCSDVNSDALSEIVESESQSESVTSTDDEEEDSVLESIEEEEDSIDLSYPPDKTVVESVQAVGMVTDKVGERPCTSDHPVSSEQFHYNTRPARQFSTEELDFQWIEEEAERIEKSQAEDVAENENQDCAESVGNVIVTQEKSPASVLSENRIETKPKNDGKYETSGEESYHSSSSSSASGASENDIVFDDEGKMESDKRCIHIDSVTREESEASDQSSERSIIQEENQFFDQISENIVVIEEDISDSENVQESECSGGDGISAVDRMSENRTLIENHVDESGETFSTAEEISVLDEVSESSLERGGEIDTIHKDDKIERNLTSNHVIDNESIDNSITAQEKSPLSNNVLYGRLEEETELAVSSVIEYMGEQDLSHQSAESKHYQHDSSKGDDVAECSTESGYQSEFINTEADDSVEVHKEADDIVKLTVEGVVSDTALLTEQNLVEEIYAPHHDQNTATEEVILESVDANESLPEEHQLIVVDSEAPHVVSSCQEPLEMEESTLKQRVKKDSLIEKSETYVVESSVTKGNQLVVQDIKHFDNIESPEEIACVINDESLRVSCAQDGGGLESEIIEADDNSGQEQWIVDTADVENEDDMIVLQEAESVDEKQNLTHEGSTEEMLDDSEEVVSYEIIEPGRVENMEMCTTEDIVEEVVSFETVECDHAEESVVENLGLCKANDIVEDVVGYKTVELETVEDMLPETVEVCDIEEIVEQEAHIVEVFEEQVVENFETFSELSVEYVESHKIEVENPTVESSLVKEFSETDECLLHDNTDHHAQMKSVSKPCSEIVVESEPAVNNSRPMPDQDQGKRQASENLQLSSSETSSSSDSDSSETSSTGSSSDDSDSEQTSSSSENSCTSDEEEEDNSSFQERLLSPDFSQTSSPELPVFSLTRSAEEKDGETEDFETLLKQAVAAKESKGESSGKLHNKSTKSSAHLQADDKQAEDMEASDTEEPEDCYSSASVTSPESLPSLHSYSPPSTDSTACYAESPSSCEIVSQEVSSPRDTETTSGKHEGQTEDQSESGSLYLSNHSQSTTPESPVKRRRKSAARQRRKLPSNQKNDLNCLVDYSDSSSESDFELNATIAQKIKDLSHIKSDSESTASTAQYVDGSPVCDIAQLTEGSNTNDQHQEPDEKILEKKGYLSSENLFDCNIPH